MTTISADGLALIQQFEGFCAEPAPLPDGGWIVGHGHVRRVEPGGSVTCRDAAELLAQDLAPVERRVTRLVSRRLTQSQFDALVSFAFSIGLEAFAASEVLRRVNRNYFVAAACAMDAWRKSSVEGELEVVDALVRRRAAEKALLLKDVTCQAAPSVLLRARLDRAALVLGAPVKYAAAPAVAAALAAGRTQIGKGNVVSLVARTSPKFEPAVRLTEILRSEPATQAVLSMQVANDIAADEDEIVTAHAKPVARSLDGVGQSVHHAFGARSGARKNGWLTVTAQRISARTQAAESQRLASADAPRLRLAVIAPSREQVGLCALLVSGLALMSIAGSLLFGGAGNVIEIIVAAALAAPGLAATLMGAYCLLRQAGLKRVLSSW